VYFFPCIVILTNIFQFLHLNNLGRTTEHQPSRTD
jgi:hypothetical protein